MKILIDYTNDLPKEYAEYRFRLTSEFGRNAENKLHIACKNKINIKARVNYLPLGRKYNWKKENKKIKSLKPDAVILFGEAGNKFLKKYRTFIYVEPLIEKYILSHQDKKIKSILERLENSTGFLVRTRYMQLFLANHFSIEKDKICVTGEGVDELFKRENITDELRITRRVLTMYRVSKPYIFVSGRLSDNPNLDKVLEVFSNIHQKNPDLKLLIASEDFNIGWDNKPTALTKEAQQILDLCERFKITRKTVFTGVIDHGHMPVILFNAVMVLHLEEKGMFSRSMVEALAAGVPLVVNDLPVFKEIIGNAGLVTTPKVVRDITDKILFLLNNDNERNILILKALQRSRYYEWTQVANRAFEFVERKTKNKPKTKLLYIFDNTVSEKLGKDKLELFSEIFDVDSTHVYKNTSSLKKIISLVAKINKYEYVVNLGSLDISLAIYLWIIKLFNKEKYFIADFTNENKFIYPQSKIYKRLITNVMNRLWGLFIRWIFKRILINNTLYSPKISSSLKIPAERIQFLPDIFERKFDKSLSVALRNSQKLKNYACITARIDNQNQWNAIFSIAEVLFKEDVEFKILVFKEANIDTHIESKKLNKKFIFFEEDQLEPALLNSKIYFDFRDGMSSEELLEAMRARNCCIVKKNMASLFLVKPGINGYIYSHLETDKILKQIKILLDNKIHLNDIRRVNFERVELFSLDNVCLQLDDLYSKWR